MQKARAEYIKYLQLEESFWQQKDGYGWFKSGDRNTKFFHSIVKGSSHRLKITRIPNEVGCWLEDEAQIANEAINFYQQQFTQERDATNFPLLDHIPDLIIEDDNLVLESIRDEKEIKQVVIKLNRDNTSGPDGRFYQVCWDIIGGDVIRLV